MIVVDVDYLTCNVLYSRSIKWHNLQQPCTAVRILSKNVGSFLDVGAFLISRRKKCPMPIYIMS